MTQSGRRGMSVGIVLLLVVAGGIVWSMRHGEPAPTASAPVKPTVTLPEPETKPTFSMPDSAPPEPLVSPTPEVPKAGEMAKVTPQITPPQLDPVVAKGRVVWAGGTIPDGVDITLFDADGSDLEYDSTDAKGNFELRHGDWLANGWSVGSDSTTVKVGDATRMIVPALVSDLPAHYPTDPPVVLELLIGFAPVLTGRVTDRLTGAPLVAAEVTVSSSHQAHLMDEVTAVTDQTGVYSLPIEDVPLQGLIVWCAHDGYQATLTGPMDIGPAAKAGDAEVMDFALDAPAPLRGRVLDAVTGNAIADAIVTLGSRFSPFIDESDWEMSEADGSFSIDTSAIPVNGSWLHVTVDDYAPAAVRPPAGAWPFTEVRLNPVATVAGTVNDASGQPINGANVKVVFDGETRDLDQGLYDETWTDATGHFELLLESAPPTDSLLQVEAMNFLRYDAKLTDVAKALAGGRYEVTIPLTRE